MKMEQTECSETSAYKIQTPGNYPEENIKHTTRHTNNRPFDISVRKLKYERGMLKNSLLKAGNWPISKSELINKNMKQFICYIN